MTYFDINLIQSIGKITVTIIILLAFFLWTVNSHIKRSNRLFSMFLLLVAFDLSGLFMYEWLINHPYIDALRHASSLLQMPLFYLYIISICYQDFKFKPIYLTHGLPFVIYLTLLVTQLLWVDYQIQMQLLQDNNSFTLLFGRAIGEVQYFFYIVIIFHALFKYKKLYKQNFSSYEHTAYKWLLQMTLVSLVAHLFAMIKNVLTLFADDPTVLAAHFIVSISTLTVISWLVLKALYHPSITRGMKSNLKPVDETPALSVKSPDTERQISALHEFMQTEKPHFDSELTIEELALKLNIPTKELSVLINHHMGKHFFKLINSYRIQSAQEMLKNPYFKDQSILQILYQVGFNSKSSFNTYFKQTTGQTPTAYRKSHI